MVGLDDRCGNSQRLRGGSSWGSAQSSAEVDPVALAQGARAGDNKAPRTVRFPGQPGSPPLPTTADVENVLALPGFFDFTHQLEQLHDNVHVCVGGDNGHMGDIPFAAFDPIFWAHHAMIDRCGACGSYAILRRASRQLSFRRRSHLSR